MMNAILSKLLFTLKVLKVLSTVFLKMKSLNKENKDGA